VAHAAGDDLIPDHRFPERLEIRPGGLPEEPAVRGAREQDRRCRQNHRNAGNYFFTRFHVAAPCGILSRMGYAIAADIVIVIHFLWIAFVILGFPFFLWVNSARWRLIHLAAVIAMVLMQVTRSICPLTYLEAWLKSEGRGAEVYSGKFIIETIERLIYVDSVTLEKITWATGAYLALIVLSFWFRPIPRRKKVRG